MLVRLDINGNPFLGVLGSASDALAVISSEVPGPVAEELGGCLGVPVVRTSLGGARVVGSLCALNSRALAVTEFTSDGELGALRRAVPAGMEVLRLAGRLNAVGNNILVNDRAALVHPDLTRSAIRKLADAFGIEVARGTVAQMRTVGSAACVTNRGLLCHPKATGPERRALEELFKVPVTVGTANFGSPMIGACLVANSKGAAAGTPSTGLEMGRIEEALGFL